MHSIGIFTTFGNKEKIHLAPQNQPKYAISKKINFVGGALPLPRPIPSAPSVARLSCLQHSTFRDPPAVLGLFEHYRKYFRLQVISLQTAMGIIPPYLMLW
jgi:hypothetical protein